MLRAIRNFLKNPKGATAIEYALIAALISVAAIAAFRTLGTRMNAEMNKVSAAIV